MGLILISYDIKESDPDLHQVVKNDMKLKGYQDYCDSAVGRLPNTCLICRNKPLENVINELKESVNRAGGILERLLVTEMSANSECFDYTVGSKLGGLANGLL